ncbi:helix-turn-helix transcriptional regulator [Croceicoccus sp. BE223]|uniref:helix-turn-helix transcriptional regulator n=1 Tax=Croceicoccus sp. BE223 TaxID=2817716 RepID=UPI0028631DD6|nr:helix-turn-helix transcriptional regulator [Croceicoccus sp. BE223]MDR7101646.1 DNA-binding CsgD family transcriptional regulator [Croceicoccus sp. BE223]
MISMGKLATARADTNLVAGDFRARRKTPPLAMDGLDAVRITRPEDVRGAAIALRDLVSGWGLRIACSHDLTDKNTPVDADGRLLATEIFGWEDRPDAWFRRQRIALNSPIAMAARFESQPFWCNAEGFHTHVANPYLDEIDLADFVERATTTSAIAVPVHMPFGQIGMLCLFPEDQGWTDLSAAFAAHADMIAIHARLFISTYARTMGTRRKVRPDALSQYEVECMRWAALGKTDLEIGMIIGRSRATVRFHIQNASIKLGAVNRCQTLFRAAQLGYVTLPQ